MVDITISVRDITLEEAKDIEDDFGEFENTVITIDTPWPKMKFGDRFIYSNVEYGFLSYVKDSKASCRCAPMGVLGGTDAYIQALYFDCSKRRNGIKFI